MLLALLLSVAPVAQTTAPPQTYRVQVRPRFDAIGYTGELKLWISSDGYVIGTYRPDTGGTLESVRGGHQGDRLWLDIPALGGLHVEATIGRDGALTGLASSSGTRGKVYVFTAVPEKRPPLGERGPSGLPELGIRVRVVSDLP